jgi:uroporphyrinogen-III synthase
MTKEANERLHPVESILVTQLTTPNNQAPYDKLVEKFGIKIDYRSFTEVRPVTAKDFRKQKINLDEFTAVIFTSKNSIDHFFKVCEELRYKVSEELKYFCLSETIALYLQKHITYRKRKVFFGKNTLPDLKPTLVKHRKKERFLLPCSNIGQSAYTDILNDAELNYQAAEMYQAVSSDISDLKNVFYDMIVFFSPLSIQALYDNFPDFKQNNTRLAAYGNTTIKAMEEKGLIIDIEPTTEMPSMTTAIENYLRSVNP